MGKVQNGSSVLLSVTDGCAKQYRSVQSLFVVFSISTMVKVRYHIWQSSVLCWTQQVYCGCNQWQNNKNIFSNKCSKNIVQEAADGASPTTGEGKALIVAAFDYVKNDRVSAA